METGSYTMRFIYVLLKVRKSNHSNLILLHVSYLILYVNFCNTLKLQKVTRLEMKRVRLQMGKF